MTKFGKTILTAAGATAMLVVGAHAFGPERHDTDGDGVISSAEYEAWKSKRYDKFDADGDGEITRAEWLAKKGGDNAGKAFDRADENGDGVLDAGEVDARIAKEFAKKDADGDGALSMDEA